MTLLEHVKATKILLAHGNPSDDFSYSNQLIAHFLKVSRAKLTEQKIDKYNAISPQSLQSLCLSLESSNFHNCCNAPDTECQVLKSVDPIPRMLNSRWGHFMRVLDLEGRVIPEYTLTQNRFAKYSLTGASFGWFLHDNHLYIINNSFLETVLLDALFDNPQEIHELRCTTTTECADFMSEEFPIDSDLIDAMYRLTVDLITRSMSLPKDEEQDAKDQTA